MHPICPICHIGFMLFRADACAPIHREDDPQNLGPGDSRAYRISLQKWLAQRKNKGQRWKLCVNDTPGLPVVVVVIVGYNRKTICPMDGYHLIQEH